VDVQGLLPVVEKASVDANGRVAVLGDAVGLTWEARDLDEVQLILQTAKIK
jgi:hypothetical protein